MAPLTVFSAAAAEGFDMMTRTSFVVPALVAWLVIGPLALGFALHRRWSLSRLAGTGLAGAGLAGAISITLLERVRFGMAGLAWRGCEPMAPLISLETEAILNWFLLVPMAFFLVLATRRPLVGVVASPGVALAVEVAQSVTGLGGCQMVDLVRNTGGGLVATVAAAALIVASRAAAYGPGSSQAAVPGVDTRSLVG